MKHLSSALTNIRRSPYQSMAAVMILTVTFLVAYTFSLFLFSTQKILNYFETRPQVIAFFKIEATDKQIQDAQKEMSAKPYVDNVSVISKDKALEIYKETNKEDPLLLELVTADILPASIEVSGKDVHSLTTINTDLEKLAGIEEVIFQQNIIDSLKSWTLSIRYVGLASVLVLSITSILFMMTLIAMKISNKRSTINIMHIIGASTWYIKAPFIYEAIIYSIVGSILGWTITYVSLLYITPWLQNFLGTIPLLPIPINLLLIQLSIGTVIGIFLAMLASASAVQRVMRK